MLLRKFPSSMTAYAATGFGAGGLQGILAVGHLANSGSPVELIQIVT